ncbi:MAG: PIN domain-containing protein [Bacteroidetes bacterium]|nr:PIN domain-containing protein [Bacteroidota bacterium]
MYLFDVTVWVNAHREDSPDHKTMHHFVKTVLESGKPFSYSPLCLSGFLRIVTHPKIFYEPTDLDTALEFVRIVTEHPNAIAVLPEASHWHIFTHLCMITKPKGNLIPDAYLAAIAIATGNTWVTSDRDFLKFPGLKCKIL